ncbi:MAG TPA: right-handed parallel beta-helix repeat-containing protein, partial [Candidatus Binatia bacterium]
MLKTFTTILTSMVSVILLTPISAQATIFVPTDQPTIQAAIDAAPDFEDIFVEPGIYYENINLLNKHLFITSVSGPEVTIIDGGQHDSVVTYLSGRGGVIAGFTMRNGRSGPDTPGLGRGAGVRIGNASFPTIIQNVITGNRGCEGIGIASDNASPTISLNVITENSQFGCSGGLGGAAVSVVGDEGTFKFTQIVENIITNNSLNSANGGGISLFSAGDAEVRANLIKGNAAAGPMVCPQGGGIWIIDSAGAKILDNIIIGNTAGCGGGVYWSVPSGSSVGPRLVNNTIVDNNAAIGAGVFATGANSGASVFNNIIIQTDAQTALECDTAT